MEMNETDKVLKNYFEKNKIELEDNYFTEKLMQKLPEKHGHSWILWVFGFMGLALTFYFGYSSGLMQSILVYVANIPIIYFIVAVFCFPLVGSLGFFCTQRKLIY